MTEENKSEEIEKNAQTLKEQAVQTQEKSTEKDLVPKDQLNQKEEDPNWRAFREARKKDRLEKEAAEKRAREKEEEAAALKAAMEAAFSKQSQPHTSPNYYNNGGRIENYDDTDDEKIERLVNQAIEKRQSEMARQQQERERYEMPSRLRQTFSDFNETVTADNLDYLEYHYPEIAKPLGRIPDSFEKWEDIYRAVKRFVPNSVNSHREAARAEHNLNKPRSISSTQITNTENNPTSYKISEQKKAENWRRMQRTLKGLE